MPLEIATPLFGEQKDLLDELRARQQHWVTEGWKTIAAQEKPKLTREAKTQCGLTDNPKVTVAEPVENVFVATVVKETEAKSPIILFGLDGKPFELTREERQQVVDNRIAANPRSDKNTNKALYADVASFINKRWNSKEPTYRWIAGTHELIDTEPITICASVAS